MWVVDKKYLPSDDFYSILYFGSEACCRTRYAKSKSLLKAGEELRLRRLADVVERCEIPVWATALNPDS